MIEIVVLDGDLNRIDVIDNYESLIWVPRYNDIGDCELYLPATEKAIKTLRKGYYLARDDDDMVCRIEQIEIDTDVENGNHLIVTGYDCKKIIDQRVVWSTITVDGYVEDEIRTLVEKSVCTPALYGRQIKNSKGQQMFYLGDRAGFKDVVAEQVSYKNVGERVRELCKKYQWGYKVIVDVNKFWFVLYAGTDRSDSVIFSKDYENLRSTTYADDSSNLANVALVAGEGEGSARMRNVSGYAEGIDRYEIYVDAKDLSRTITFGELTTMYPLASAGGQGYIVGTTYRMGYINIIVVDDDQLRQLKINYPDGEEITIAGNLYYRTYDPIIADLQTSAPEDGDAVILRPIVYEIYLLTRGYEKLSEFGGIITFEGSVEPDITFVYKRDYFLGDIVTVVNEYGIEVEARIVEVVENEDVNGYKLEPKFEYQQLDDSTTVSYMITESLDFLGTENGYYIVT